MTLSTSLFDIAPWLAGAWLAVTAGMFLWLTASVMWAVREDNLEDARRVREDAEVAELEQIPVPGRWQHTFPEAGEMSTADGLGGAYWPPVDEPGMG